MAGIADQHQNLEVFNYFKRTSHAERRTQLASLAAQPITTQIKQIGSLDTWAHEYRRFEVPNNKVDQVAALERLAEQLRTERSLAEDSLKIAVQINDLPPSKRQQYNERLREHPDLHPEWNECFVRLYTAAEWAVERWARTAKLECIDLNIANRFGPQDYRIDGRNVDVKTTISVGRPELKSYWSPDNLETGEIICAVRSTLKNRDEGMSEHRIQGIFHSHAYDNISVPLTYFQLNNNLFNPCYFHTPKAFFGVKGPPDIQVPHIDADVTDYCIANGKYLAAIFYLPSEDPAALLRKALPPCQRDFVPVAAELIKRKLRHLLSHYLADYCLSKIKNKESIDTDAVTHVLWSICEPYPDQELFLRTLLQASAILPIVRCAHHPDEGVERMNIEVAWGERGRLILRARCPTNRTLSTTFLAYSWKTLETLVYGGPGISVCDAPDCGCLTHMYDGRKIGRRYCSRYGDHRPNNSPLSRIFF